MLDSLNIGIAFLAGLLSFASPCVIVLVPIFLSNLAGVKIDQADIPATQRHLHLATWLFVIGFTVTFTVFGALAGLFAKQFVNFSYYFNIVAGILIIFFGLTMIDVIKLSWLQLTLRLNVSKERGTLYPLLMGIAFAAGWTPCVGPVLAAILLLAGASSSVVVGSFYLLIYSLGLMIPFLLVGYFLKSSQTVIHKISRYLYVIKWIAGLIVIGLGILLITGDLGRFISYFYFLKPPSL
jgi:cytochrome c-type biogenesis protein